TRSAGEEAVKRDKRISWTNADGRKQLLSFDYPMVAGDKKFKVDAFLTGVVSISPDFKTLNVVVQGWDNKNSDLQVITKFTTRTDRSALVEMNRSFAIKRATALSLVKSRTDLDDAAANEIENKVTANDPNPKTDALTDYLDFQLLYDGQPVSLQPTD